MFEEFTSFQKEHEFVMDNYRQYIIEQLKLCPQINRQDTGSGIVRFPENRLEIYS